MLRSIRWRIAIPYVVLLILLSAAIGIYLSNLIRQIYIQNLQDQLTTEAILVRDFIGADFKSGSPDLVLDAQAKHFSNLVDARVTLIAADGTVIGESHDDRTLMNNHANRPEILQARANGQGSSIRFSDTEKIDNLYAAVPVYNQDQISGYIRLALPLTEIQSSINQIERALIFFTVIAALIAILLATWIAGRTTKPLRELTEATRRYASGDLESRIIPTTSDEVGLLTRAFNTMGEQILTEIQALKSERSKLSAVLNEMSDGVLILDGDGTVQLINPAAEKMFGINPEEAIGQTLIQALRQHQLVDLWNKCRETGEPQAVLIEIPGQRVYLQSVATSLGEAMPDNTLLLFQNLTRLRHLETVRQDFMSNISHELRTPLASLKALTETLMEGALDDPPAARRFLERIETEVDSISLMVSELLELSRIESGRVPLKMQAVQPQELVDEAVERLRLQAERSGLDLIIECAPNTPPVLADPSRLEQVLVNLLHNAIKFTPQGGQIITSCSRENDKVLFIVKDTGVGIPADDLSRIFERFYKTDRARSSGGTGLGLAIARHIVEAHGGKIWAQSIEDKGSSFYFTIPIAV